MSEVKKTPHEILEELIDQELSNSEEVLTPISSKSSLQAKSQSSKYEVENQSRGSMKNSRDGSKK